MPCQSDKEIHSSPAKIWLQKSESDIVYPWLEPILSFWNFQEVVWVLTEGGILIEYFKASPPPPPCRRIDWKLLGFSLQFHTDQQLFVTGSFHLFVFCIGFTETNDNSFTRQQQFVTWSFYLCHYHRQQSIHYQLNRKSSNAVQSYL